MILTDQQIAPIDITSRQKTPFTTGDTVRVHQKITEKDKVRIQVFEGVVIARKHGTEPGATFTVRRVGTDGIAVEKIFPLYTPTIDRIEMVRRAKTRRAKAYFLRGRTPRQIREKLRKTLDALKGAVVEEEPKQEEKQGEKITETQGNTEQPAAQQKESQNVKSEAEQADQETEQKPITSQEAEQNNETKEKEENGQ